MKIKETLGINNAKLLIGNKEAELNSFTIDTRLIQKGDTFIGIKGENVDGSNFYLEALKKGAATIIISNITIPDEIINTYQDRNIIEVDNSVNFIMELAKKKRNSLKIPIIAVTGSVGKTSTKNIIADILSSKYKVLKSIGNYNTKIGLSLTILSYINEDIIVLEMGMQKKGEISTLTNIAHPTVGVITNIGSAHIGYLGSRENILQAKLELLEGLNGPLIINGDNDLLSAWYNETQITNQIITFGLENPCDYTASNITYNKTGSHFNIKEEQVSTNVYGRHFIYNSLVAFAIGDLFSVPHESIIEKLKNIPLEPNRMEISTHNNITIINDAYNSSYESVYYALEVLKTFPTRKIAILGDILELGEYSTEIHTKIGKLIVPSNIDILITIGENSLKINENALNTGFDTANSYHFSSNKEGIDFINSIKQDGDTILLKASQSMHFSEIVENLKKEN